MLDAFVKIPMAHRTLHDVRERRPENSLAGAQAAITAGYGMEIDLQISSDGVPMVFHDDMLQRLTRHFGRVSDFNAAQLQGMRLTHGDEGIPTLEQMLTFVSGRVPLLVEIKDQDGQLGPSTGDIERAVCDLFKGYSGAVALMSFNPHSVAKCASFLPDTPRGLVTDPFLPQEWPDIPKARLAELAGIPDYDRVGASFISHSVDDLANPEIAKAKAKGAAVFCWTVKSAEQEVQARKIAQNITFEGYLP